jgi:hypothetical protein
MPGQTGAWRISPAQAGRRNLAESSPKVTRAPVSRRLSTTRRHAGSVTRPRFLAAEGNLGESLQPGREPFELNLWSGLIARAVGEYSVPVRPLDAVQEVAQGPAVVVAPCQKDRKAVRRSRRASIVRNRRKPDLAEPQFLRQMLGRDRQGTSTASAVSKRHPSMAIDLRHGALQLSLILAGWSTGRDITRLPAMRRLSTVPPIAVRLTVLPTSRRAQTMTTADHPHIKWERRIPYAVSPGLPCVTDWEGRPQKQTVGVESARSL